MTLPALHMLAAEYRAAALQLADLELPADVIADTLESMSGDIEEKAQNVAYMVRSLEADAASLKAWADQAAERSKAATARAAALRGYIAKCLAEAGIEAVKGPGIAISWRRSTAVQVYQPELVPDAFLRHPPAPPPEPDKVAIKAELPAGRDVPGCALDQRRAIQIK